LARKIILYTRWRVCETPEELLSSECFEEVLKNYVKSLVRKHSYLLKLFGQTTPDDAVIPMLIETFKHLVKLPACDVPKIVNGSDFLFQDTSLFSDFVEQLYNYWRSFNRFLICDSEGESLDRRPYRTFNVTVERLSHLIRSVYRDIEENLTGSHPRIYRQINAGAEIAAISLPKAIPLPGGPYSSLHRIPVIRQVLLNPPLILNPPMNKRTGQFVKVHTNPLLCCDVDEREWLCYPAKVGHLVILVYFHEAFFELGFSLCNLFEIADDNDLLRKPDALYLFGVDEHDLNTLGVFPTVFYDDPEHDLLVAAAPRADAFGYFGYLKKMVLTLHNIRVMKEGRLPFHGAFVKILLNHGIEKNILIIGDTGAGKSETLEAFRILGEEFIQGMFIIADDMGSLHIDDEGTIVGYGTEIGAFLRLDDLQPGYAFGQIDRSIIMSPSQINARIVLPVTTYETVIRGHAVDMLLYANNYEQIDEDHPIIEPFNDPDQALTVFREGTVMSKGTTTSTGIVHSYFANIFGPPQYKDLHEKIARVFFNALFNKKIFVGQMRTRLGIAGYEISGPQEAAQKLIEYIKATAA
ncbi:MAG: phosphoenolpyruvate carboxykinase, partial [Desulfobacterota bacterium]|nr:phosphoenolpyruvate carboxykinase [Thermodesulfobacteriota bacterium]